MTQYKLVTNAVQSQQVRETESAYIIEDVPFVRPMELAGGYVPEESIESTIEQWDGVPVTLNHPRNARGEPIAANRMPETHLGIVKSPYYDGEAGRGDVHISKADLESTDGSDVVQAKLEAGEQIDVSSQYAGRPLPAGEYDGQMRENVEAIARPDSVAILPTKRGRCSIEDGCGIDPQLVANADVRVPMTRANADDGEATPDPDFEAGDLVSWSWSGGTATGRIAEVYTGEGTITRTFDSTEISKDSDESPVYLVDVWRGDGYRGQALRQAGQRDFGAWDDPPDEALSSNAPAYELPDLSPDDVEEWTDAEWDGSEAVAAMPNPSEDDDAPAALDQTHAAIPVGEDARDAKGNWKLPFRQGPDAPINTRALVAIDAVLSGGRGGVDGLSDEVETAISEWVGEMLAAAPDDLFGATDDQSSNALERLGRQVASTLGLTGGDGTDTTHSEETMPAESGVDWSPSDGAGYIPTEEGGNPTPSSSMDRETLIEEITANSALTEAALDERCDDGLEAIHNDIMSNDNDGQTANDDEYVTREEFDELREEIPTADEIAEQVTANRDETKKDELAQEIVANSAEYDDPDDVREDYPTTAALETKRDQVTGGTGVPTAGGLEANVGGSEDEIDVSSGLLGGDD